MASRTSRPSYYDPEKDPVIQRIRSRQIMQDLVENEGYDPGELQDYVRRGGKLTSIVPRPKPVPTPEEEEMTDLKRDAATARLKRSINPSREYTDPVTGQMSDIQTDERGMRTMIPQQHSSGAARFRPKEAAFKGTNEAGDQWEMDRGEYGEAANYRVKKPGPTPDEKRRKEMDAAAKEVRSGKTLNERAYENRFVKGTEKRNDKGEWSPDPESFEPSEAVKKTHGALSRELNGTKQEIFQLERQLATYPNPELKSKVNGLRSKQQNIEAEMSRFEDAVKREAGEPVLQKLRGFKGEYPESNTAPNQNPQYDAAMKWLESNPDHPKAPAVREKLKKLGL